MKRILALASIILLAAPVALFAGNGGRDRSRGGPSGIHSPGTAQPGGTPQGTPGGQRLRDGSGAGQKKQNGNQKGQGNGQGQHKGQGSGQCPAGNQN